MGIIDKVKKALGTHPRVSHPEQGEEERHADESAATRLSVPGARMGAELSGEPAARRDGDTAEALKLAAENEQRS